LLNWHGMVVGGKKVLLSGILRAESVVLVEEVRWVGTKSGWIGCKGRLIGRIRKIGIVGVAWRLRRLIT